MVAVPFVSASTTCKECPDDNGPRAWPRNSDGSMTDDARCCGATRDSNGSTDAIVDALDSTSDREEKLVPVARLLPDAGDTITGSIAHMRRRLKSPRRPDRPKWSRKNPGQGTMFPRKPALRARRHRNASWLRESQSWGNDCSTLPIPRATPCLLDGYEGRARLNADVDSGQKATVRGVEGESDLIPVNPLKTRGPSLHPEPRPGTSNYVRRTLAPCQRTVNARVPRIAWIHLAAGAGAPFRENSAKACAGSAEKIVMPGIRGTG